MISLTKAKPVFTAAFLMLLSSCVVSSRGILLDSILQSLKHIENMMAVQHERGLVRIVMPFKNRELSSSLVADETYDDEQASSPNKKRWLWPETTNKVIQMRRALEEDALEDERPAQPSKPKKRRRPRPVIDDIDIDENVNSNTNFNSNINYGRRSADYNANENFNVNSNGRVRKGHPLFDELDFK